MGMLVRDIVSGLLGAAETQATELGEIIEETKGSAESWEIEAHKQYVHDLEELELSISEARAYLERTPA